MRVLPSVNTGKTLVHPTRQPQVPGKEVNSVLRHNSRDDKLREVNIVFVDISLLLLFLLNE